MGPILTIDATTDGCSVAIVRDGSVLALREFTADRGQAEILLPLVQAVSDEAGIAPAGFTRIAVTTGPGSFTGIRIGLAAARGLALVLGVPAIGIDTFAAIAHGVPAELRGEHPLMVVIDSKREELFAQTFDAALQPLTAARMESIDALLHDLPDGVVLAGTGAELLLARRPSLASLPAFRRPDPKALAALAARVTEPVPPLPFYLRPPDAKTAPVKRSEIALSPAHADVAAALHQSAADETWDSASFATLLSDPAVYGLLAIEGAVPVGLVLARVAAGEAEILTIATTPQARGRGVATGLLRSAMAAAASRQATAMFLEVATGNQPARALYARAGFEQVGVRKRYYASGQDALVLRRELGPGG